MTCCDNCEEGIEPCCDEELAQHIEQVEFVPEVKAKNRLAEELSKHLCCQNKFYIITKAMVGLNAKELTKLRDGLRKFTPTDQLHPQLEGKFRHALSHLV